MDISKASRIIKLLLQDNRNLVLNTDAVSSPSVYTYHSFDIVLAYVLDMPSEDNVIWGWTFLSH